MRKPVPVRSNVVAYHGTNHSFDRFDHGHQGRSCGNPTTRFGFFFTSDKDDALSWPRRAATKFNRQGFFPKLETLSPKLLTVDLGAPLLFEMSPEKFKSFLGKARPATIDKHRARLQAEGYDGFTVQSEQGRWFCLFDCTALTIIKTESCSLEVGEPAIAAEQPPVIAPTIPNLSQYLP
jgi:hypothetical protein